MKELFAWLKSTFPVLFSPQWWGIVGTAFFSLAKTKGWIDLDWASFLQTIFGFGTAVGITMKGIKNIKKV